MSINEESLNNLKQYRDIIMGTLEREQEMDLKIISRTRIQLVLQA